jgi:hypothetical protein
MVAYPPGAPVGACLRFWDGPNPGWGRVAGNTPVTADRASQVLNERIGDDALIEI